MESINSLLPQPGRSDFLILPREIRDEIFSYLLVDSDALLLTCYKGCAHSAKHRQKSCGVEKNFSALRATSRLLKAEAEQMFFKKNTFYISPIQTQGDSLMFEYVSHCACDYILRHVRRIGLVFIYARVPVVVELRWERKSAGQAALFGGREGECFGWVQTWFPQERGCLLAEGTCWKARTARRVQEFVEEVFAPRRDGEGIAYDDVRKIAAEVRLVAREEIALLGV